MKFLVIGAAKIVLALFTLVIIILIGFVFSSQILPGNNVKVNKIILSYEEGEDFNIEPYMDCLYEVNKDKTNLCLERVIEGFIEKGRGSDALLLIKAIEENDESLISNCRYLSERVGKVFRDKISLEGLLLLDFDKCNYGFHVGVFGTIGINSLKDYKLLTLINEACNSNDGSGVYNSKVGEICYKAIANVLVNDSSKLDPMQSRAFCIQAGDPEGVCLSKILENYATGTEGSKLGKDLFSNKEKVVESLLYYCKSEGIDNTAKCLTYAIANIFTHNEKLIYLAADYCAQVGVDLSKRCYREMAKGFNLAIESSYRRDNQIAYGKEIDKEQIFKIFIENQLNYCKFLGEVVGVYKDLVDQCQIGLAIVLLEYYEIDEGEACKYFNKKDYFLCKVAVKIHKGESIASKYEL
jgi:hypothetical protein